MAVRISDSWLREQAPPASGDVTFWDDDVTGFGVRFFAKSSRRPDGARSFFLNYRAAGREKRFTIGSHPEWTAKAAREEAKRLRREIDRGADPATERRERREAPTVRDLAERYRAEHLPSKARSSQANDSAMITKYILPALGERKVAEVHDGDVRALHRAISAHAPIRANRVMAVLSKMFALSLLRLEGENAAWRDQAQGNPCKGVARNQEEGHERFFSPREMAALGDALADYGQTPAADCIRFVMLTGCRPGEAMHATWQQVDDEPGSWVKPSSHTKQRKIHRVPLGPAAIELLDRIRKARDGSVRRKNSNFIFPGQTHDEPLKQLRSTWEVVTEKASIALWREASDGKVTALVQSLETSLRRTPTVSEVRAMAEKSRVKLPPAPWDARIYDLRHSFATTGVSGGLTLPIIGRLLGHTQTRTTQRYAHFADEPLREAASKISGTIANAGKCSDNVVKIERAR